MYADRQHFEEPVFVRQNNGCLGDLGSMMDLYLQMPSLSLAHPNDKIDSRSSSSNGYCSPNSSECPNGANDSGVGLSLSEILQKGFLIPFAKERLGSQRLQMLYPFATSEERRAIAKMVIEDYDTFTDLTCDIFGNHFVQRVMEYSTVAEQRYVVNHLKQDIFSMCLHRYANRVVQNAFDFLTEDLKLDLISELAKTELASLCIDQNGNHVIQKIMTSFPMHMCTFLVKQFVCDEQNLFHTIENKFGCLVVQKVVEQLASVTRTDTTDVLLKKLLNTVTEHSLRLTLNEFSNYVIQFIISCPSLALYRDRIIENCILRNILSFSQDKHASHVVQKAVQHAPPALLHEIMDEILDGYLPHPETGKDALDIIMFHQYGNYVVQEMLSVCVQAVRVLRSGQAMDDMEQRLTWLRKISEKIWTNEYTLAKWSSGKKMIDMLSEVAPMLRCLQMPPSGFAPPGVHLYGVHPFSPVFY